MTPAELERDYRDYLEAWPDLSKARLAPGHKPLTLAEYVVEVVLPEVRQVEADRFCWSE